MIEPEDRWEPWPVEVIPMPGPERVYDDKPTTDQPRPVGFTAHLGRLLHIEDEIEPLLWEGED